MTDTELARIMRGLKFEAVCQRWSGHGEGGNLVSVTLTWVPFEDCYESTPKDIEVCQAVAKALNSLLKDYQ